MSKVELRIRVADFHDDEGVKVRDFDLRPDAYAVERALCEWAEAYHGSKLDYAMSIEGHYRLDTDDWERFELEGRQDVRFYRIG